MYHQPHTGRLDIIHHDIAHADPGVVEQTQQEQQGECAHKLAGKQLRPEVVIQPGLNQ